MSPENLQMEAYTDFNLAPAPNATNNGKMNIAISGSTNGLVFSENGIKKTKTNNMVIEINPKRDFMIQLDR